MLSRRFRSGSTSLLAAISMLGAGGAAAAIALGTAQGFGVLGAATVTNTGATTVTGNVGSSDPSSAVTGFPPGVVSGGVIHAGDAAAAQAKADLATAYDAAGLMRCNVSLTDQNLAGVTLTPGVYCFTSSAQLSGTLTLDLQGNPNAQFVFQIASTLTTASGSTVTAINGNLCDKAYWRVGSSATLGTGSTFAGDILALTSATLTSGANTSGRVLARNGAVTMDSNNVNACAPVPPLDEQIQALLEEKATRTATQQKLDSQFMLLLYPEKFLSLPSLMNRPALDANGRLGIVLKLIPGANLTPLFVVLRQLGLSPLGPVSDNTMRLSIEPNLLETLAGLAEVRFIGFDHKPIHNAKASTSEGDKTHQAEAARQSTGKNGLGQKVCVISDGINSLALRQATGDLPPSVDVLLNQTGNGDEGTAMLEIVYDLAPGATLGFATSNGGEGVFAQNIRDLADPAKGACHIIVDDTDYVTESPFQDGVIADAVNFVTNNGALYFSSAGNSGNLESNFSGTWEGDFSAPHGLPLATNFGSGSSYVMHEFASNITGNVTTSTSPRMYMHWADPAGASTTDYDFYLLDAAGKNIVAFSTNMQNGTQNPFEFTEAAAPYEFTAGTRIVVAKASGAQDRMLNLQWFRGRLTYATSGATRGHSAAANSFSVAATPAAQPQYGAIPPGPYPGAFTSSAKVEVFSSDGPRRIFFDVNGTLLAGAPPGNFKSTGGIVRQKPDIVAADGVKTDSPGFSTFYGTSAAAPHAAAIAALVRQANPGATAAQLRDKLKAAATPINNSVISRGAGVLMASTALQATVPTGPLDVDDNGSYDPLTDGFLVLRWMFGVTGPALVNGALGSQAKRVLPADIVGWLEPRRASFDVDLNSTTDALTDGLLILRYMYGIRGSALVKGAVGSGAGRNTPELIQGYISTLMP